MKEYFRKGNRIRKIRLKEKIAKKKVKKKLNRIWKSLS